MPLEHRALSERIIGGAIQVHRTLGPGFIESVYEEALCYELPRRGLKISRQHPVEIFYEDLKVGDHELDLFVENEMVVELKAVKAIDGIHFAKVRSYLRAVNRQHGLILNFSLPKLEIRRVITSCDPPPAFLTSCFPDEKEKSE